MTDSVNATHPIFPSRTLFGAPKITVGDKQYLEIAKGNKEVSAWLVGSRQHSTRVSKLVGYLMSLQVAASKSSLGHVDTPAGVDVTTYRRRLEIKALKK